MKELLKTKVTVRLRKAENRKEWYIYLESYPVMIKGKKNIRVKFQAQPGNAAGSVYYIRLVRKN